MWLGFGMCSISSRILKTREQHKNYNLSTIYMLYAITKVSG